MQNTAVAFQFQISRTIVQFFSLQLLSFIIKDDHSESGFMMAEDMRSTIPP